MHQSQWIPLFILLFAACDLKNQQRLAIPAFYYWKSEWKLEASEIDYLNVLRVKKVYLRYFDVAWDEAARRPVPLAVLSANGPIPEDWDIVPTVFITNQTLKELSEAQLPELCERIYLKIKELSLALGTPRIRELQFDCDWTDDTRYRYFHLLDCLKQAFIQDGSSISATIRLHQVKFWTRTGVPPVDRGMLMFYNTGDIDDPNTTNSILDLATARQYLYNFDSYPLDLDLALPLFAWGVLYRDGQLTKLINQLEATALTDTIRFSKLDEQRYQVKKSTYLEGYYLYKGDEIRLERVEVSVLQEAIRALRDQIRNPQLTLTFYHFDNHVIKNYSYEQLETLGKIWME